MQELRKLYKNFNRLPKAFYSCLPAFLIQYFLNSHSNSVRTALKIRQVTMGK
jgi:hypothetical protein